MSTVPILESKLIQANVLIVLVVSLLGQPL